MIKLIVEYISKRGLYMEKNSILIVDDDQDIVRFMNVNLMQEGFKVLVLITEKRL